MMNYATDSHFLIGRTHSVGGIPCQDYALAEVYGDRAIAVVSDGCSSGGRTDAGARLVSFSALRALKKYAQLQNGFVPELVALDQAEMLKTAGTAFDLTVRDTLATSLFASFGPSSGVTNVNGDGVIAYQYRDGSLVVLRYEWQDNMPFYPAYTGETLEQFIEVHGGDLEALRFTETRVDRTREGIWGEPQMTDYTLEEGIAGMTEYYGADMLRELEYVALFTDGVAQVDGVDWKEAVRELLAFKNTEGAFAKRRMIRFVKDVGKRGNGPLDDIAYAVIRFDEETEEVSDESDQENDQG